MGRSKLPQGLVYSSKTAFQGESTSEIEYLSSTGFSVKCTFNNFFKLFFCGKSNSTPMCFKLSSVRMKGDCQTDPRTEFPRQYGGRVTAAFKITISAARLGKCPSSPLLGKRCICSFLTLLFPPFSLLKDQQQQDLENNADLLLIIPDINYNHLV